MYNMIYKISQQSIFAVEVCDPLATPTRQQIPQACSNSALIKFGTNNLQSLAAFHTQADMTLFYAPIIESFNDKSDHYKQSQFGIDDVEWDVTKENLISIVDGFRSGLQ